MPVDITENIKVTTKIMSKEIMKPMSDEIAAQLRDSFPVEPTAQRITLPRLGMVSQDITEETKNPKTGKKEIKVIVEAGTFFTERQTEELDENGKKVYEKTEIGTEIEVIILYFRKQLRFYDKATEMYTSSPIFDNEDEIIPLWREKKEVHRGLPSELRKLPEYQGLTAAGKPTSKLEDNRILYVKYEDEVYQMNVRGTSMYAFRSYMKDTIPNKVITKMGSEAKENGATSWNQTTFEVVRPLNADEAENVLAKVKDIQIAIGMEKTSVAAKNTKNDAGDKEMDEMVSDAQKALGDDKPAKKARKF